MYGRQENKGKEKVLQFLRNQIDPTKLVIQIIQTLSKKDKQFQLESIWPPREIGENEMTKATLKFWLELVLLGLLKKEWDL